MTEDRVLAEDEGVSLFALGTAILRYRWRIALLAVIGGAIAAFSVYDRPLVYQANASFMPQGYDAGRTGLAGLAGQLGVSVSSGGQTLSPEFYSKLLKSRVLLQPVVNQQLVVQELGGRRVSFLDLFNIQAATASHRQEQGVKALADMISSSVSRSTGVVEFSVRTKWPSVSLAIAQSLVSGLNAYNRTITQGQAATEREFIEGRLNVASAELRQAEDRLERFLNTNRNLGGSPELTMTRDRIQRDVTLRQEVYTSLMKSYEDVRIREVRDTPTITVFEPPFVLTDPEPRGRITSVLLGLIFGGFLGVLLAFGSDLMQRFRRRGNPEAAQFLDTISQLKRELTAPARWVGLGSRR